MKIFRPAIVGAALIAAAGFFAIAQSVFADGAAAAKAKAKADAIASTNFTIVELPVPLATFDLTNRIVKDPFFPNTLRAPIPQPVAHTTVAISASCFELKGLSGAPDQRLALINNRTLAAGESADINTPHCGKLTVHCIQIKEFSAIIRIGNQETPIEIFLPKGAR